MSGNARRKFSFKLFAGLTLSLFLLALLQFRADSSVKLKTVYTSTLNASGYQPSKDDGTFTVEVVEEMMLHDAQRNKELPIKISFPKEKGVFPVIVFSHGAGGSGTNYFPLTRFWASHGYIVIQPTHDDSIKLRREKGDDTGMLGMLEGEAFKDPKAWENRARDISFILDSLKELERRVPALKGKMDMKRLGVGGHSYGAYTTQLIGGAVLTMPETGKQQSFRDDRARALLMLSPQGRNTQGLTETSWQKMARPFISMTGTNDRGFGGQTPEWRTEPFKFSPAGDKYQLFIEGANHFSFTGRLAEDRPALGLLARRNARSGGGATDQKAIFDYVKMASLAFWDAYLKDDAKAKEYLKSDILPIYSKGAVTLSKK